MSTTIDHIETLISKAGDLAETKVELWKLKAAGKVSDTISSLIAVIAITVCIAIAIMILSIGVAIWIGNALENLSFGFLIVGGFYALAGILFYMFRKIWIKTPINNLIIDKIIKE